MDFKLPDEMPDIETLKWWNIRDILLNPECLTDGIINAYNLALNCTHEDAKWLVDIIDRHIPFPEYIYQLKYICQNDGRDDPRALFFGATLCMLDISKLIESAIRGYTIAKVKIAALALNVDNNTRFELAKITAMKNERDAFVELGQYYKIGCGVPKNEEVAKLLFKRAVDMGHRTAPCNLAKMYDTTNFEYFYWMKVYFDHGGNPSIGFMYDALKIIKDFKHDIPGINKSTIYKIGEIFKNHIDRNENKLFEYDFTLAEGQVEIVHRSVQMYDKCCSNTREAVNTFTCIMKRANIVKDIRLIISKLIWNSRKEGLYINSNDLIESR